MSKRPIDNRTLSIVAQAQREHFTITGCAHCGGPEIHSQASPLKKSMGCGASTEQAHVTVASRRRQCKRCKRFFRTTVEYLTCAGCRGKLKAPEDAPKVIRKVGQNRLNLPSNAAVGGVA